MTNMKIYNKYITAIVLSLVLASCKVPLATVVKDEVKENIPQNFNQEEQGDANANSGTTPWRQFLLILI